MTDQAQFGTSVKRERKRARTLTDEVERLQGEREPRIYRGHD